jgi:hypothetical protein
LRPKKVGKHWVGGDVEPLREDFDYDNLQPHQKAHLMKIAHQVDGWVIVRHTPERIRAYADRPYRIYPELRPDKVVRSGIPTRHWHGDDDTGLADLEQYLPYRERHNPPHSAAIKNHIKKAAQDNPDPERFPEKSPSGERYFYGGHGRENTNEPHYHLALPKYVFECNPHVRRFHDHEDEFKGKPRYMLTAHLRDEGRKGHRAKCNVKHRDGKCKHAPKVENVTGRHAHWVPDDKHGWAKRLDVHPWVEELGLFDRAQVVFFGIEGCMKADAILSAGEAVFSVPAVGQWHAPELARFVRTYLRNKLVVIVPDSDWHEKPEVLRMARDCQEFVRGLGVVKDAVVAAPPPIEGDPDFKVGIDDHLGPKINGKLEDLDVIDLELNPLTVEYVESWPTVRRNARRNTIKVLQYLAMNADNDGEVTRSQRAIARRIGRDHETVKDALDRLVENSAITRDGDTYRVTEAYRAVETKRPLRDVLDEVGVNLNRHDFSM